MCFLIPNLFFFFFLFLIWHILYFFSCVQLFATLWTVACQAPLSVGFSRQRYWSVLPCSPPGDLLIPGTEPACVSHISWIGRQVLYHWRHLGSPYFLLLHLSSGLCLLSLRAGFRGEWWWCFGSSAVDSWVHHALPFFVERKAPLLLYSRYFLALLVCSCTPLPLVRPCSSPPAKHAFWCGVCVQESLQSSQWCLCMCVHMCVL